MNILKSLLRLQFFIVNIIMQVIPSNSECFHHKITQNFQPSIIETSKEDHRILQASNTRPIKILFDETNIASADDGYKDYILNQMVPVVQEFLSSRLIVISSFGLIKMPNSTCFMVRKKKIYK
jgi:hypothetical protein